MKNPVFTGTCTALVTPFINGRINYPMAEQLLRRQMDNGISAVVLAGTTGESATLSDAEKIQLFKRCKTYCGDQCTIIAGTGSNSTDHAVALSVAAESAGADALLLVSPYYNKATPDGLIAHYLAVANAVSIPIILYNVPTRTGVDIPVEVYKQLSVIPNIAGVKEASSNITKIARIRNECPQDFYVWSGNDDQIVPTVALGGKGVISVLSNICPSETEQMLQCALTGNFKEAAAMQCDFMPLIDLLFCEVNPIPVKAAMKMIGYDCGKCRLPLVDLSRVNRKRMEAYLK